MFTRFIRKNTVKLEIRIFVSEPDENSTNYNYMSTYTLIYTQLDWQLPFCEIRRENFVPFPMPYVEEYQEDDDQDSALSYLDLYNRCLYHMNQDMRTSIYLFF